MCSPPCSRARKTKPSTRSLTIARRSTDRIQRLVSSLLDINRLESGQTIVSQQAVPATLVDDAIESRPSDGRKPAPDADQRRAGKLPDVWVDVDMIRRVLINLLENASKFTPAGREDQGRAETERGWVQLWVQDNGPASRSPNRNASSRNTSA